MADDFTGPLMRGWPRSGNGKKSAGDGLFCHFLVFAEVFGGDFLGFFGFFSDFNQRIKRSQRIYCKIFENMV